jgi:hypothetical protein
MATGAPPPLESVHGRSRIWQEQLLVFSENDFVVLKTQQGFLNAARQIVKNIRSYSLRPIHA